MAIHGLAKIINNNKKNNLVDAVFNIQYRKSLANGSRSNNLLHNLMNEKTGFASDTTSLF